MNNPHGGELVNRFKPDLDVSSISYEVELDRTALSDLELISNGAYSPLTGFINEKEYLSVLTSMHLSNGIIWSIPITLPVKERDVKQIPLGSKIKLTYNNTAYGVMELKELYKPNKLFEAEKVYLTTDKDHPGVQKLFDRGDVYLSGPVYQVKKIPPIISSPYSSNPKEVRNKINEKGWKTIVGFQTRNPIHRAHEYIQKCALEIVDGLLLHPLVGETKADDIPATIRLKSYETLIDHYYPKNRILIGLFHASMRYAGPREAIFHAIVRKNFGCTHFIVGRDHAGVGNYYGTYDAQKIFNSFKQEQLGITPIFFEHSFFCKKCDAMATSKTCPHNTQYHVVLSGTKVREMLKKGIKPPLEITRPEVAELLAKLLKDH
ncbi:sulfate adenylyltransferase [Bacillus sp. FJAT-47783]|uniref:sulfate adenylyltransferase n=1 Tax=Bacillus sp. FJAT-47783 TaxID=2922712 RepID=UPI001FAB70C6|nr:sulfate adenylyltransferase [Bacillus sp. FJAT-47783]